MWIRCLNDEYLNLDFCEKLDWKEIEFDEKVICYEIYAQTTSQRHTIGYLGLRDDLEQFMEICAFSPNLITKFNLNDLDYYVGNAMEETGEIEELDDTKNFDHWYEKKRQSIDKVMESSRIQFGGS